MRLLFLLLSSISELSPAILESYIATLHEQFKPKTVKRKLASLKAFFHYLDYRDRIVSNPFNKLHIKFREPVILPKTIPLSTIESLLTTIYQQYCPRCHRFSTQECPPGCCCY
ncbi:MAG: site-specific integrase [Roseburia sp.]